MRVKKEILEKHRYIRCKTNIKPRPLGEVDAHADGEGKEKVSLKQTTSQASTPPALLEGEPLVLSDFYKKYATKTFSTD